MEPVAIRRLWGSIAPPGRWRQQRGIVSYACHHRGLQGLHSVTDPELKLSRTHSRMFQLSILVQVENVQFNSQQNILIYWKGRPHRNKIFLKDNIIYFISLDYFSHMIFFINFFASLKSVLSSILYVLKVVIWCKFSQVSGWFILRKVSVITLEFV